MVLSEVYKYAKQYTLISGRLSVTSLGKKKAHLLIRELDKLKTVFGRESAHHKKSLLKAMSARKITSSETLQSYHDILCFLRAYPDNAGILKLIESQLKTFAGRVELYKIQAGDRQAKWLADSGIVNSSVSHTFSFELTAYLVRHFKDMAEIDWDSYNEQGIDTISAFLPLLVSWQENDTLDNDLELETADWLKLARAKSDRTDLSLLTKLLTTSGLSRAVQRHLYENAEIPVKWILTNCRASRTLKRIPCKKIFYQNEKLIGRTRDLRARLGEPPSKLVMLPRKQGEEYVNSIKDVLGVRCRELYPLIHANASEIYISEPGRGLRLVILGDQQDIRLPLEANFGAMLVRNGMPVGYGIGCMFFDRCEIAINVFPSYRSGESSFIIEEFFRLFYHHFGARELLVRSYQIGDDNEEALESGSFWFYYKLGFRSVNKQVRKLADKENEKIKANKNYRSSLATLKKLAKGDIFFHIDPSKMTGFKELPLKNLGHIVTDYVKRKFDANRRLAEEQSVLYLARILKIKGWHRWTAEEIDSFKRLAPLIASIPGLNRWSPKDKADLAKIIRAKGSINERNFVLLCNKHPKFRAAIHKMAFGWGKRGHN